MNRDYNNKNKEEKLLFSSLQALWQPTDREIKDNDKTKTVTKTVITKTVKKTAKRS